LKESPQPYTGAPEHKRLWGSSIYPKIFGFKYKDPEWKALYWPETIERSYKLRKEREGNEKKLYPKIYGLRNPNIGVAQPQTTSNVLNELKGLFELF